MSSLLNAIFPCRHKWAWPQNDRQHKYPAGYDSTQHCCDCGVERYYSFQRMQSGPVLKPEILVGQEIRSSSIPGWLGNTTVSRQ